MRRAAEKREILSSLYLPHREPWRERVDMVRLSAFGRPGVLALIRRAAGYRCVVLNGAQRVDQVTAALLAIRRSGPVVVITDCTWELPSDRPARLALQACLRLIDRGDVTYCVLSSYEERIFAETWGVAPERVVFTPFCWTLPDEDVRDEGPGDGSVFAGGDSMRDYRPLLEAASAVDGPLILASSAVPPIPTLPANVRPGRLTHGEFMAAMRRSSVVVVPLAADIQRSAGQQTYLNAMALGKIVVVTDSPGARDYVEGGVTGLIVPPADTEALGRALRWALHDAPQHALEAMRTRARQTALEQYGPGRYVQRLLLVAERALTRAAARA
jgi:hypothetical protein